MSDDFYVVFAHPDIERDLKSMAARHWWEAAYRDWRENHRDGEVLDPRKILAGFHPRHGSIGALLGMDFRL